MTTGSEKQGGNDMGNKYVYSFSEGSKEMKNLLGGKGSNLAEMTNIGLPVPPGFTISTEACIRFYEEGEKLWLELIDEIHSHLEEVEKRWLADHLFARGERGPAPQVLFPDFFGP